jgi:broad specificity phosphatase PhoE
VLKQVRREVYGNGGRIVDKSANKIYLVRHAESLNNDLQFENYNYDSMLTPIGRAQAVTLSRNFSNNIQMIIYSSQRRTQETAHDTILRFPNAIKKEYPVHEFDYLGESTVEPICKINRTKMKNEFWQTADLHFKYNQKSESFYEFLLRVEKFINELRNCQYSNTVVFSHKYFVKCVCWYSVMYGNNKYYSIKEFKKFCDVLVLEPSYLLDCLIYEDEMFIRQKFCTEKRIIK